MGKVLTLNDLDHETRKVLTLNDLGVKWGGANEQREGIANKSARSGWVINHLSDDQALVCIGNQFCVGE